jgi:hypothetical protein
LLTLEFTDNPDGPGKDWSCVNLYLGTIVPDSFIVVCLWHPKGARDVCLRQLMISTGRGNAKPLSTSSVMTGLMNVQYLDKDLWLPRSR